MPRPQECTEVYTTVIWVCVCVVQVLRKIRDLRRNYGGKREKAEEESRGLVHDWSYLGVKRGVTGRNWIRDMRKNVENLEWGATLP